MTYAIVYSSRTGNTEQLARTIQKELPAEGCLYFGGPDEAALAADRLYIGFWTDKGSCDEKMAAFLSGLGGKEIALFGTAGFGKEDAYFEAILGRVKEHLPADCRYLGGFMCPGKMGMGIRRRYEAMLEANPEDSRAKMLLENFDAVLDRPNDQDLEALTNWARSL